MQKEDNIITEQINILEPNNISSKDNTKTKGSTTKKRKFKTKNNKTKNNKNKIVKKGIKSTIKNNIPDLIINDILNYKARIKTSEGDMIFKLYLNEAPRTVNNFIFLAKEGFYSNNQFHRIISNFIIQGGCPKGDGTGSIGYKFKYEESNLDYYYGSLVMISADNDNKGGKYTNGCQFFIVHGKQVNIFKKNTVFGMLIEGGEVLDRISEINTLNSRGELSKPITVIKIINIEITEEQERDDDFEEYNID